MQQEQHSEVCPEATKARSEPFDASALFFNAFEESFNASELYFYAFDFLIALRCLSITYLHYFVTHLHDIIALLKSFVMHMKNIIVHLTLL